MGRQLTLALPKPRTWGGRRRNAGRPPRGEKAGVSHLSRERFPDQAPVHVTLRMLPHVWNLRSRRCFAPIVRAVKQGADRLGCHVIHVSVQGNHIHLIVEADHQRALARGIQGLSIRIAKALNRVMGRKGKVFADRYHAHVLKSPTEVLRAMRYVLHNAEHHGAASGQRFAPGYRDPFSTAPVFEKWQRRATTWLLREGWKRAGPPAPSGTMPSSHAASPGQM